MNEMKVVGKFFRSMLTRLFPPKEIKAALGVVNEAKYTFKGEATDLVLSYIQKTILEQPDGFVEMIRKGMPPREMVFRMIAKRSGNLASSGNHHIYRGVFADHGPGEALLTLSNAATDELEHMGAIDHETAGRAKQALREEIQLAG